GLPRAPARGRHLCHAPQPTVASAGHAARRAAAEPVGATGAEALLGLPRQAPGAGAAAPAAGAGAAVPARADDRAVSARDLASPDGARARRGLSRSPHLWPRGRPARAARGARAPPVADARDAVFTDSGVGVEQADAGGGADL